MTIKELQTEVEDFCGKNGLKSPLEFAVLDALSELGEVAKELLKAANYGRPKPEVYMKVYTEVYPKEVAMELGDLLYSLITVANSLDIDLEQAVKGAIAKYEKRLLDKGEISSK